MNKSWTGHSGKELSLPKWENEKKPYHSCQFFDKCSVNKCPLDPEQRTSLSGEPKCRLKRAEIDKNIKNDEKVGVTLRGAIVDPIFQSPEPVSSHLSTSINELVSVFGKSETSQPIYQEEV